jgi:hypothetical protein
MDELRDYIDWHREYDDPTSGISWRLSVVRRYLNQAFDRLPGPVSVLSLCAGDGRDVIGTLAERSDAARVRATLVELHPDLAASARASGDLAGLGPQIDVRAADASTPATWADVVPVNVALLVGIFGNISDDDLWRTIDAAPALCAPGATLIWSRGLDISTRNDRIRARFTAVGFTEVAYDALPDRGRPALGAFRYEGPPTSLPDDAPLFTFIR